MNSTQTIGKSGNGSDGAAAVNAGDAREKLMGDLKNVINEAEEWIDSTGDNASEEFQTGKKRFLATLQTAKTDLLKLEASVRTKTKLAAQATDTYVQEHPWQSVTLGAVVGVALGLLIARK